MFVSNFENLDLTFEKRGCTIVCTTVKEPQNYGVVELKKKIISIEEKPKKPKSNLIATGLYFFDKNVVSYLKNIKTSNPCRKATKIGSESFQTFGIIDNHVLDKCMTNSKF